MANNALTSIRADTGKQFQPRSGFWNWLQGNPELFQQIPKYSPQMMQGLEQLFGQGLQGLQNPQAGFEPIAQNAQRQFETETVPGLAERFTAMGGGQRSSAFQNALGSAGAGLQSNLAALGANYGLQNRQGLLDQIKLGLTPSFETLHRPREAGFLQNLLPSSLSGGQYRGGTSAEDLMSLFSKFAPLFL